MSKTITLATLHKASEQEVFDQVARHLLTQKAKSEDLSDLGKTYCVYRNTAGYKCAAGCLIADKEYSKAMEGHTWDQLADSTASVGVPIAHVWLITRLQVVHDTKPVDKWADELLQVALLNQLSGSVVKEFSDE